MDEARLLALDHPDALALVSAMARRFPHWSRGWTLPGDAEVFVVIYRDGRPAEGAALVMRDDGLAEAMRFSAVASDQRRQHGSGVLLTALERAARDRGAHRLRLDESCFLLFASSPDGYAAGPDYDGDADVATWVERRLAPGSSARE